MTDDTNPDDPRDGPAILEATNLTSLVVRGGGISVGILAVLVLLRVVAVSGWSWHTAAAVAETIEISDVATIGLGTVFEQPILTGLVVAIALPLTIVILARRLREDTESAVVPALLIVAEVVTGLTLVISQGQWWVPVIAVVMLTGLIVGESAVEQHVWRPRIRLTVQVLLVVAVATSLLLAAVVPTPWVPRERIVTTDDTFEGYVLETQAGFLKVLNREKHELLILPVTDVESREIHE